MFVCVCACVRASGRWAAAFRRGQNCSREQYIAGEPTFDETYGVYTSNSICEDTSLCQVGEFEDLPPTTTTDRICGAVTACDDNSFEVAHPTATSDRVCQSCDAKCEPGYYTPWHLVLEEEVAPGIPAPPLRCPAKDAVQSVECFRCPGNVMDLVLLVDLGMPVSKWSVYREFVAGLTSRVDFSDTRPIVGSAGGSGATELGPRVAVLAFNGHGEVAETVRLADRASRNRTAVLEAIESLRTDAGHHGALNGIIPALRFALEHVVDNARAGLSVDRNIDGNGGYAPATRVETALVLISDQRPPDEVRLDQAKVTGAEAPSCRDPLELQSELSRRSSAKPFHQRAELLDVPINGRDALDVGDTTLYVLDMGGHQELINLGGRASSPPLPEVPLSQVQICLNSQMGCGDCIDSQLELHVNLLGDYCQSGFSGGVPRTDPWRFQKDIYFKKQHGTGRQGGKCTCPSGKTYFVGDNGDSCGSLDCVGGASGTCSEDGIPWSAEGMAVKCGRAFITLDFRRSTCLE